MKEIHIFLTALMFYTRIPCPKWVDHRAEYLNKATRYFPLIGWLVGLTGGLTFYGLSQILPASIALLLSMLSTIMMTGGFHEDAIADVCDGFGGGWTKAKILTIMKDSATGAYGVMGLFLALGIKFFALFELSQLLSTVDTVIIMILGHTLSRTTVVWMIYTDEYVRENEDSKAKPIAQQMTGWSFTLANIIGFSSLVLVCSTWTLVLIPVLLFTKWYFSRYFKKWIGGYTGDCLGTLQQVSEIMIYLTLLAVWKYI
ncbi:MAG: adenosylcobinamide-GDP ribazoletransferase [Reichenbachiella sp.]